ncbi:MAG: ATP phosphoribosyltransferase regulatory subunit [Devosiaceae bacterium]|nr:ATP phosphoribosyltransferase regulatory subunit [Devosiaceae bacterium]
MFEKREQLLALLSSSGAELVNPATLLPASDYFDLAGEEFGRHLLLTEGADGVKYCLRPDFTLPIARQYIKSASYSPASLSYLGPVFRQRADGPSEFEQAGLELIAQENADAALYQVFDFVREGLEVFAIESPSIRIGCVALFEELLEKLDMPDVWKPRLRRRFGSSTAMENLLQRLSMPQNSIQQSISFKKTREQLIEQITQTMLDDGLSLIEGRLPEEIAERFLEKQALAAAKVPEKSVALLRDYLAISDEPETALNSAEKLFGDTNLSLESQLNILRQQAKELSNRFPNSPIKLDLSFSPRLHYYTGLVFELAETSGKTIASGGQYDRLLQALGASKQVSASGGALWVNRLEEGADK